MKTNFLNLIARPFTRTTATRPSPNPRPQSPWTPMEHMESRTMMSADPTVPLTFFVDGIAPASTHTGGANFVFCDGSVRFVK